MPSKQLVWTGGAVQGNAVVIQQRTAPPHTGGGGKLFRGPNFHHSSSRTGKADTPFSDVRVFGGASSSGGNEGKPPPPDRGGADPTSEVRTWWKQCEQGQAREAVEALELLVQRDFHIDVALLYSLLKRCMAQKDLSLGKRVHAVSVKCGYEANAFLANHIICMYAAHGRVQEAAEVFSRVPAPNAFMWASIIKAHAERGGDPKQAMDLYRQMRDAEKVTPNNHVFVAVLKACAKAADLAAGKEVHADILGSGVQPDAYVGNCLVDMYAKCGSLEDARRVFDRLPSKDVVTWTAIIAGYTHSGLGQEALKLYDLMQQDGLVPGNQATFVCLLKACATVKDLQQGKQLHEQVRRKGLETDMLVASCLVDMYAKCGCLEDARSVFDRMPSRDVVAWTAMIGGYAQHGRSQEVLALYASMQQEVAGGGGSVKPNQVTFVFVLQACGNVRDLQLGRQLHAQIQQQSGLAANVAVGSCLVDMYAKCGSLDDARQVFDSLPVKDVVTWTALVAGYGLSGLREETLAIYAGMQQEEGITPTDQLTFVRLLQAFTNIKALPEGRQLHALVQERGLETDVVVGGCLVEMYVKCGSLEEAKGVFARLPPSKDVVTWAAMIAGTAELGLAQEARSLYASMRQEGIVPANQATFVRLLQACASIRALKEGRDLHALLLETRVVEVDTTIGNCLVDMYAKCGSIEDARTVFNNLPAKDVVTWTSMMAGYAEDGHAQEALSLYASMQREEGETLNAANQATFVCLLQACAAAGALQQGKQLDADIQDRGLGADLIVGNCLIDMYTKCGSLEDALRVFDRLPTKDVITWTALLNGYAHHGDARMAIQCFEDMQKQGVKPNHATFVCLLVACSHGGLVEEGQQYFKMMEDQGPAPTVRHYNCMVDLLGRAGRLQEAEDMLRSEPSQNDLVGWRSLLTACTSHGDVERGRRCFHHIVAAEPEDATAYVLMGNMYINAEMWNQVEVIENMRVRAGARKKPAKACIEVKYEVHEFNVGDERDDIAPKLKSMYSMVQGEGFLPKKAKPVSSKAADAETRSRDAFFRHAEKMALAYGLMHTPEGTRLLITKNLRMCNDCHDSTKTISRIENREIVVRDGHRVHRFQGGVCSCGDRH